MIAELFTEGTSPFDLSQLLAYRAGEYSLSKLFHTIDDVNIRVSDLLQLYIHCSVANFVFGGETINTFCKHLKTVLFFLFQEVGAFVIVQFLCNFYKCSYLLTYLLIFSDTVGFLDVSMVIWPLRNFSPAIPKSFLYSDIDL